MNFKFLQSLSSKIYFVKKILLLVLVVVLTSTSIYSQTKQDSTKFEIGLGLPHFPLTINNSVLFPVISFKAIHNKNAFRGGIVYDLNKYVSVSNRTYLLLNVGYERRFLNKKSQFLTGIDICFLNRFRNQKNNTTSLHEKYTFYHFGAGPVIGYSYSFTKKISFQTELGLYYGYGRLTNYSNGVITSQDKGGFYTAHRFLSLSLYYIFLKNKLVS